MFEFSCAVVVDAGAARSMMRGLQPNDYRSHKIDKNQLYFFFLFFSKLLALLKGIKINKVSSLYWKG